MEVTLQNLIREREHQQQDFKHSIEDQKKIARTLVAFANTDGGRLLIGVKDNGKIVGVNPEEEFHMIEGASKLYCEPSVKFETKIWKEGFKMVLEIYISESELKNHKAQNEDGEWKTYIRKKDNTLLANKIILKIWNFKKMGIPRPLTFGEEEQLFLVNFQSYETLTLSKLYKINKIPNKKVDHILALFIYWKIIEMDYVQDQWIYKLK